MFASRFASVATGAFRPTVRQCHGHARGTPAEMRADTVRWKNISIGMTVLTAATCLYVYIFPEEHEHQRTDLPYWHHRVKPFPWKECSNCGLLEMPCWIECRKENKAKEDAAAGHAKAAH